MEQPAHTTRVTHGGFVICVCGWATAAGDRDAEELAARHVTESAPAGSVPTWVERPGGTVCVPEDPLTRD